MSVESWMGIILFVISGFGVAVLLWLKAEFKRNDDAHERLFADHEGLGNSVSNLHRRIDWLIMHIRDVPPFEGNNNGSSEPTNRSADEKKAHTG